MENSFYAVSATPNHPDWKNMIARETAIYKRDNDIRTDFARDFNRIIYSDAYKRLKHKTQVFYSPQNDHICTRMEHVNHVESISHTIAHFLGLNEELTRAIAIAHDLGHAPFGHKGETILNEICKKDLQSTFWHEKNGLFFVDNIELLEDYEGFKQNLNLTYAVRDGIISHCGEIDENSIFPRKNKIDLYTYAFPNQYAPYTWEACVVKIADKISYIGRDIEDAITLGILDQHLDELYSLVGYANGIINNTVIIYNLIYDLCTNSSPEKGLCFSEDSLNLMNKIKEFNYQHIYGSHILNPSNQYFHIVIHQIYDILKNMYGQNQTFENLDRYAKFYPNLIHSFKDWIKKYFKNMNRDSAKNKILFDISIPQDYYSAIVYYISGMTDKFAIDLYNEIIGF